MSDFVFSTHRTPPGALAAALERYLAPVTAECREYHGSWGSLAVVRGTHDPDVVVEDEHSLSVLVGEPIVRGGGEPAGLARTGARRDAVHRLLGAEGEVAWDERLDGPYAALRVEKGSGRGTLVTDLFSFIPVYAAGAAEGALLLGTHVDCVARAAGRNRELDLVSATDMVVNWASTFPYTLYAGVRQVAPASEHPFGPSGWEGAARAFWLPLERREHGSPADAAASLREGFAEDVRVVCEPFARVGLLFSGGEDARVVLGAVPPGVEVRAFTYADWENREVRVARNAARAYGAEFVFAPRAPDHYMDAFEEMTALVGSDQLFTDAHGYGLHERLRLADFPVVLGGFSSDAFLKASYVKGNGRGPASSPFRLPPSRTIRKELLEEVLERRTAHRRRMTELRPGSAAEWDRLWPFSMRKHAANLHGNRRMFATHEPYHCNAVVKVSASVPVEWKRHRALFLAAMRPFLARSWHVPHARSRFPFAGRWANVPLGAGLRVGRILRDLALGELRTRQGPWPKWEQLYASGAAERRRRKEPLLDSPVGAIFTPASEEEILRDVETWAPLRRIMLMQMAHLSSRAQRA